MGHKTPVLLDTITQLVPKLHSGTRLFLLLVAATWPWSCPGKKHSPARLGRAARGRRAGRRFPAARETERREFVVEGAHFFCLVLLLPRPPRRGGPNSCFWPVPSGQSA